jgi:4-diphosphocytidyl-2-C-methyl-D-erythritol kinase
VLVFPNCKINLGLHIVRKRKDSYHDLETVFYPLQIRDALEILEWKGPEQKQEATYSIGGIHFSVSGSEIPVDANENLCVKACQLLKRDFPQILDIRLHLHKSIPIGAGLGGGSADAAFTLCLLNEKFNLGISLHDLQSYASQIGSDCPFFILNQPAYARGRGEILEKIELDLSGYSFLLLYPRISISTAMAFSKLRLSGTVNSVKDIVQAPIESWKDSLRNDFEPMVFNEFPELLGIRESLYQSGAIYASMTGSGSAIYGIFKKNALPDLFKDKEYLQMKIV